MVALDNFFLAFIFSFIGSIPPGTINLTVVQLVMEQKTKIAIRFALAASLIEYPYSWIAVKFERLITSSAAINENIHLIGAILMIALGAISLWPRSEKPKGRFSLSTSGYRRGVVIGLLNPLAIPYWLAITAYLRGQGWLDLSTATRLHAYLAGVVAGAFLLLVALAYFSKKVIAGFAENRWLKKVPALLLIVLGCYGLAQYFFFLE